MADVRSLTLDDFTEQLAAEQPTPGGGSGAAHVGALGAALISMSCRYTVGREKYAAVEDAMRAVLDRAEELRGELQALVQDDVEAYGGYSDASKLPKDTDEQKAARDVAMADAMRASTDVPLAVAERCAELTELALRAAGDGNPWLISDAAVGGQFALAGFDAAALNVELNLGGIDDGEYVTATRDRLQALDAAAVRARVDETVETVRKRRS
jgi:formiminotetrahydrofolate cyclodeaminase